MDENKMMDQLQEELSNMEGIDHVYDMPAEEPKSGKLNLGAIALAAVGTITGVLLIVKVIKWIGSLLKKKNAPEENYEDDDFDDDYADDWYDDLDEESPLNPSGEEVNPEEN